MGTSVAAQASRAALLRLLNSSCLNDANLEALPQQPRLLPALLALAGDKNGDLALAAATLLCTAVTNEKVCAL